MTEREAVKVLVSCYDDEKDELDFEQFEKKIIEKVNEDTA